MDALIKLLIFLFLAPFIGVILLMIVTTLNVALMNLLT